MIASADTKSTDIPRSTSSKTVAPSKNTTDHEPSETSPTTSSPSPSPNKTLLKSLSRSRINIQQRPSEIRRRDLQNAAYFMCFQHTCFLVWIKTMQWSINVLETNAAIIASRSPSLSARIRMNSCCRLRFVSVLVLTKIFTGLFRDKDTNSWTWRETK